MVDWQRKRDARSGSAFRLASLMLCLVTLASCADGSSATTTSSPSEQSTTTTTVGPPSAGGELTIAQGALASNLDPALNSNFEANAAQSYFLDTLVTVDPDGQIQPLLATGWEQVDATTLVLELREGVTFSNDEPFNAEAAKFTLDRIADPDVGSQWAGPLAAIDSVEASGESELTIRTASPFPELLRQLSVVFMVPPGYLEEVGDAAFGQAPIGTGPFVVTEFTPGEGMRLERNETYWGEPAKLDAVQIRVIPEQSSRIAALQAGEVDLIFPITPDQVARVQEVEGVSVTTVALGATHVLNFRQSGSEALQDVRVRQAINYALDKDALFESLMGGLGSISDGQLAGPETFGYNPTLEPFPFDQDRARQLLSEAGYPEGFEIEFQAASGRRNDVQVGEAIAEQLRAVGIRTVFSTIEGAEFSASFHGKTIAPLHIWGWNTAPTMSVMQPYSFYRTSASHQLAASEEFDRLFEEQASETDVDKRAQIVQEMAVLFREEALTGFLWQLSFSAAASDRVNGLTIGADTRLNIREITVD